MAGPDDPTAPRVSLLYRSPGSSGICLATVLGPDGLRRDAVTMRLVRPHVFCLDVPGAQPGDVVRVRFFDDRAWVCASNHPVRNVDGTSMNAIRVPEPEESGRWEIHCTGYAFKTRASTDLTQYQFRTEGGSNAVACTTMSTLVLSRLSSGALSATEAPPREALDAILLEGALWDACARAELRGAGMRPNSHLSVLDLIDVEAFKKCMKARRNRQGIAADGFRQAVTAVEWGRKAEASYAKKGQSERLPGRGYGLSITCRGQTVGVFVPWRGAGELQLFDSHGYEFGDGQPSGAYVCTFRDAEQLQRFLAQRFPHLPGSDIYTEAYEINYVTHRESSTSRGTFPLNAASLADTLRALALTPLAAEDALSPATATALARGFAAVGDAACAELRRAMGGYEPPALPPPPLRADADATQELGTEPDTPASTLGQTGNSNLQATTEFGSLASAGSWGSGKFDEELQAAILMSLQESRTGGANLAAPTESQPQPVLSGSAVAQSREVERREATDERSDLPPARTVSPVRGAEQAADVHPAVGATSRVTAGGSEPPTQPSRVAVPSVPLPAPRARDEGTSAPAPPPGRSTDSATPQTTPKRYARPISARPTYDSERPIPQAWGHGSAYTTDASPSGRIRAVANTTSPSAAREYDRPASSAYRRTLYAGSTSPAHTSGYAVDRSALPESSGARYDTYRSTYTSRTYRDYDYTTTGRESTARAPATHAYAYTAPRSAQYDYGSTLGARPSSAADAWRSSSTWTSSTSPLISTTTTTTTTTGRTGLSRGRFETGLQGGGAPTSRPSRYGADAVQDIIDKVDRLRLSLPQSRTKVDPYAL
ncbi:unnamed protein product [Pedinophyceae sp. YPF-701]|nr:unnamed protein product [Pedinophyceae sp. YPF-701]